MPHDLLSGCPALKKLFLVCLVCLISSLARAEEPTSPAPLFATTLNDLDDKPVALEQYRGKPLVVNFWARWCAPCRAEIPELLKFRNAHKGKVEILGIGLEDKAEPARDFARANGMDYPVLIAKDKGIPLMMALGNTRGGLPYTLFIDRNGQVVEKKMGILKKADFAAVQDALLKK